jgi:hypothetical protein
VPERRGWAFARAIALALGAAWGAACGDDVIRDDAGAEAGPPDGAPGTDASACDPSTGATCACAEIGTAMCVGAIGYECCDGTWQQFLDGPCAPVADGGSGPDTASCETSPPPPSCACEAEGATRCVSFRWRQVCRDGFWRPEHGRICC